MFFNTVMSSALVLYHADCMDGFGAAWAAHKHLSKTKLVTLIPVYHGQDPPQDFELLNKHIYLVDFCYKDVNILKHFYALSSGLTIIDHHKSAKDVLDSINQIEDHIEVTDLKDYNTLLAAFNRKQLNVVFDENKSGAYLTWEHLEKTEPPTLIKYISDRDLWNFKLPYSKEINAFIESRDKTLQEYDWLHSLLERHAGYLHAQVCGQAILDINKQHVARAVKYATLHDIAGYKIPVTNTNILVSEVGHALLEANPESPFSVNFYIRPDGKYTVSLRGKGVFDLAEHAKSHGGGGHFNAAGFDVSSLVDIHNYIGVPLIQQGQKI